MQINTLTAPLVEAFRQTKPEDTSSLVYIQWEFTVKTVGVMLFNKIPGFSIARFLIDCGVSNLEL